MATDDFITVGEAAQLLGVGERTVRYHISRGNLRAYKQRGRVLLRRAEVMEFNEIRPVGDGDDERTTTGHEIHH